MQPEGKQFFKCVHTVIKLMSNSTVVVVCCFCNLHVFRAGSVYVVLTLLLKRPYGRCRRLVFSMLLVDEIIVSELQNLISCGANKTCSQKLTARSQQLTNDILQSRNEGPKQQNTLTRSAMCCQLFVLHANSNRWRNLRAHGDVVYQLLTQVIHMVLF